MPKGKPIDQSLKAEIVGKIRDGLVEVIFMPQLYRHKGKTCFSLKKQVNLRLKTNGGCGLQDLPLVNSGNTMKDHSFYASLCSVSYISLIQASIETCGELSTRLNYSFTLYLALNRGLSQCLI